MKYCNKCLMPDTRPGIVFENGVWHEKFEVGIGIMENSN